MHPEELESPRKVQSNFGRNLSTPKNAGIDGVFLLEVSVFDAAVPI